jgi:hypothetical protein
VETLLSTACLLQLTAVVDACCSFLMKQLHPSNCIGIRLFADAQGCVDLLKVAHNFTTVRNLFNYFQILSIKYFEVNVVQNITVRGHVLIPGCFFHW